MNLCIKCKSSIAKKWYTGPKCEKCYRKEWYTVNKSSEHQKNRKRKYFAINKDTILEKTRQYKLEYYSNNKEKIKKQYGIKRIK